MTRKLPIRPVSVFAPQPPTPAMLNWRALVAVARADLGPDMAPWIEDEKPMTFLETTRCYDLIVSMPLHYSIAVRYFRRDGAWVREKINCVWWMVDRGPYGFYTDSRDQALIAAKIPEASS